MMALKIVITITLFFGFFFVVFAAGVTLPDKEGEVTLNMRQAWKAFGLAATS